MRSDVLSMTCTLHSFFKSAYSTCKLFTYSVCVCMLMVLPTCDGIWFQFDYIFQHVHQVELLVNLEVGDSVRFQPHHVLTRYGGNGSIWFYFDSSRSVYQPVNSKATSANWLWNIPNNPWQGVTSAWAHQEICRVWLSNIFAKQNLVAYNSLDGLRYYEH